jgi:hypothetical protein
LDLERGQATPTSEGERRVSQTLNQFDLKLNVNRKQLDFGSRGADYNVNTRNAMIQDQYRRENLALKFPQAPSGKEFHKMFRDLAKDEDEERQMDQIQRKLVEDHGIYPSHRMDAYMLDDDSHFPSWIQQLPWSIRDRVKYGKMGLTEEDEVLRVRLGRLPVDQRMAEWERIKKAKEYAAAHEERLSPTELRDARRSARRFHWLQRKRQRKATMLRRMALRKPDQFEVWPSDAVDYSRRLSMIAQHVENGVATKGSWPLDSDELAKAKIRRRQDEAERTFMKTTDEKKMLQSNKMNGSVAETLRHMDKARGDDSFKRISRKAYANRVNAVKHGDQDEYGRSYKKLKLRTNKRMISFSSIAEMAVNREVRKEPLVNTKSRRNEATEGWNRRHSESAYAEGIPTVRYGQ